MLEGLLEGMNQPPNDPELFFSFKDCHVLLLRIIQGSTGLGAAMAMHHVTHIFLGASDGIIYNPHAIILLISMQIVDIKLLDEFFAKVWSSDIILGDTMTDYVSCFFFSFKKIENGHNLAALSCSINLVNAIMSAEIMDMPITDVRSCSLLLVVNAIMRLYFCCV